jgi:hypothetical protein
MELLHLTTPSPGRLVLGRTQHELLWTVGRTCQLLREDLLAFCVVDEHVHLVVRTTDRPRLLQRWRTGLSRRLDLGPTHIQPVQSRTHLRNLESYMLLQPRKHGLREHPSLYQGSCAGEILGWRVNPFFDSARIQTELPRSRPDAWARIGLVEPELGNATELAARGPDELTRLAKECLHLVPHAKGRVRALVGSLCGGHRRVAEALGLSLRGLRNARAREVPTGDVRALGMRVAIDGALMRNAGLRTG